ncbi:MAG: hypothetical protein CMN78_00750 [Spirochaetales bacterium]|nr:hypothetical protein [Spirochaetales bacterium]
MKLTKKHGGLFVLLIFIGFIVGSLAWEVVERIVVLAGGSFELKAGPVVLDLGAVFLSVEVNPGTLFGICLGLFLFSRI